MGFSVGQMKALASALAKEASSRQAGSRGSPWQGRPNGQAIFSRDEIATVCNKLRLDKGVDSLIEAMRTECFLLLKGSHLYQLQTLS